MSSELFILTKCLVHSKLLLYYDLFIHFYAYMTTYKKRFLKFKMNFKKKKKEKKE